VPDQWSEADITVAQARCNALLKSIDAVVIPEAPFRSGPCGTPAPVRLISIGKSPEVAVSPAPVLTCDMVAALHKWIKDDLQPLARKHLGEPIIRIETMSDYSCRAAYGRKGNRLSEHGRANALDIRGFAGAKGQQVAVLGEWGKTERDIKRELAVARAAAEKAEKERAAAAAASGATDAPAPAAAVAAKAPGAGTTEAAAGLSSIETLATSAFGAISDLARRTLVEGMPKPSEEDSRSTLTEPSRLGGPKEAAAGAIAEPLPAPVVGRKGQFLRAAHTAACRIFGTTLGPEANEAHRNHLHIDMAVRTRSNYCE
jgi:hypothetical protein